jgi:hypothetical protein
MLSDRFLEKEKLRMTKIDKMFITAFLAMLGGLGLSACGASTPEPPPTLSVEAIQTYSVSTFAAGLTQTAIAMPTDTPTSTSTPTNTPTPTPTRGTPFAPGGGTIPTVSCYGLSYLNDVTIPDNTPMVSGQTFTKTWRVKNTGSCIWDVGFKLVFTGGDAMSGAALVLSNSVSPGAETELSIAMTAPNKTGTVRGNWRMSTASGMFFGDEMYIIISLGGATATGTVTATATGTVTATATGGVATATPTPTETQTPTPTSTP